MATLTLSGCVGGEGASAEEVPATHEGAPDIFGTVIDITDGSLVPGANVTIPDLGLATRTDAEGAFSFRIVAHAGSVDVVARKEGYRNQSTTVTPHPGFSIHIAFRLLPDGVVPVRTQDIGFQGFLPCTMHTPATGASECPGGLLGGATREFRFPVQARSGETLRGVEVRLDWRPSGPASETLHLALIAEGIALAQAVGASGLRVMVEPEMVESVAQAGVLDVVVDVDPDAAGVTFAQRFAGTTALYYEYDP